MEVLQVDEQVYEGRVELPVVDEGPVMLATPDMAHPSPNRSPLDAFRVCRVFDRPITAPLSSGGQAHLPKQVPIPGPLAHPFRSDSAFELVRGLVLGPSSKTVAGMDLVADLLLSGKVTPEGLKGFKAATELRHLDEFAARSVIAGGPWQTGSVKIRMPCMRSNNPQFSIEAEAPEFEVPGIRSHSLVDIITSKVKDPSISGVFVQQPFTEWWCPLGSDRPIRIYGEAYSSNIAVQLAEEIKGIPPLASHPHIEDVIILLTLGSDATHLANFGTASLWPIYLFFGNMSKYDSSKPSEFPACHLAYLPKVGAVSAPQLPPS